MEASNSIKLLMSGGMEGREQCKSDQHISFFTHISVTNAIVHEVTDLLYLRILGWIQRPNGNLS